MSAAAPMPVLATHSGKFHCDEVFAYAVLRLALGLQAPGTDHTLLRTRKPGPIEAADIVVHLRYPTARETSAALLRVLAQGRPAVISDVDNFAEIPDDAVVRADTSDEEGAVTRAILRLAGFRAVRVTSFWQPGLAEPTPHESMVLGNVATAAALHGVRVYISIYNEGSRTTPLTESALLSPR